MLKKVLIVIFSVILLTGCAQKNVQEEITFSSWGSITETKILRNLIDDFEQQNPNIKVNFMHIPQNYFQKLHLLFASNTAPDVIFINNIYLPIYSNHLLDLTNIFNKNQFYSQATDCMTYENKLLAIPRDISSLVFYVNTDLVSDSMEEIDLDAILKIAKKSTNANTFGISFEEDIFWIKPYLAYFGEEFDEKFEASESEGFQFYINLRDKYQVAPTKSQVGSSTLAQMFLDEKIAIYLSGRWLFPKIKEKADFNWIVVDFPKGKKPIPCDASGWAISKNSKHKKTALKFVEFLSNEQNSKYFAQTGLIVPANIEASKVLNNKEHNEFIFLENINYLEKSIITKDYKKLMDKFNSENF